MALDEQKRFNSVLTTLETTTEESTYFLPDKSIHCLLLVMALFCSVANVDFGRTEVLRTKLVTNS